MARQIKRLKQSARTIEQVIDDFVIAQTANGLSEVTLRNYKLHLHSISQHLDIHQPMDALTKRQLGMSGISAGIALGVAFACCGCLLGYAIDKKNNSKDE